MTAFARYILIVIFNAVCSFSFAQNPTVLKPGIGIVNDYTKEEQVEWQQTLDKLDKISSGELEYEKLTARDKELIDSMEMGYGPTTDGAGCSWYCGGQMYKVTSGSYLKAQGNIDYKPANIHDFDLFTAWVPDTVKGVIGKKISFYFKPLSPRVNEITIFNGYIKNKDLFKANSRVKRFKLYINNAYYTTLELLDTTASQTFTIKPLQSKDKKKDLVLTFEIADIYKGDKYLDVAVSEINFSGLDVH